jgi:hypothetical protein
MDTSVISNVVYSLSVSEFLHIVHLTEETMFDEKYLDQFYNRDLLTNPDRVTPDLKRAYFMYVDIFCKATSSFWRKYINNELILREEAQYTPNLTTSDEALTLWLLHEEFAKAKLDAVEISRVGTAEWNKSRDKRKRGQHTTVAKQSSYVSLYSKVMSVRNDVDSMEFWKNLYFNELFSARRYDETGELSRRRELRKRQSGEASHQLPFDNDF